MDKFNRSVSQFLVYLSPVVIIAILLSQMGYSGNTIFYDLTGWTCIIWFTLLIYYFFALAFSEKLKNAFVRKLAGIRENDERESLIAGNVSKKTFISMTGILVLLLFLSVLKINITKAEHDKHGTFQIGLSLSILNAEKNNSTSDNSNQPTLIKFNGLPLSADGTLLLVMVLQLAVFYYFSRAENKPT